MKTTIFTFILSLVLLTSYGQEKVQKFRAAPEGTNGYVVKMFNGKSSSELFDLTKEWADYNEYDLTDGDSEKKDQFLSYAISEEKALTTKENDQRIYWDLNYDMEVRFQGKRSRYDIKNIKMTYNAELSDGQADNIEIKEDTKWAFYNKKEEAQEITEEIRTQFAEHLNKQVYDISKFIRDGGKSVNDW